MDNAEIAAEVVAIVRKTFGAPDAEVTRQTQSTDVDGWDSLSHATLLIMIERRFGIAITEGESNELANVGDLIDLIQQKVTA
ncbi:MAG TPA: acyl carrier protein [Caulobacteraceae bacterium]